MRLSKAAQIATLLGLGLAILSFVIQYNTNRDGGAPRSGVSVSMPDGNGNGAINNGIINNAMINNGVVNNVVTNSGRLRENGHQ